mmetsp:Transcript_78793/g.180251  ORF Transcript_78793/g.180251 Transcript_78793/m.180251 type:complete len:262 (-) Transcript_78793:407-1192(-)
MVTDVGKTCRSLDSDLSTLDNSGSLAEHSSDSLGGTKRKYCGILPSLADDVFGQDLAILEGLCPKTWRPHGSHRSLCFVHVPRQPVLVNPPPIGDRSSSGHDAIGTEPILKPGQQVHSDTEAQGVGLERAVRWGVGHNLLRINRSLGGRVPQVASVPRYTDWGPDIQEIVKRNIFGKSKCHNDRPGPGGPRGRQHRERLELLWEQEKPRIILHIFPDEIRTHSQKLPRVGGGVGARVGNLNLENIGHIGLNGIGLGAGEGG